MDSSSEPAGISRALSRYVAALERLATRWKRPLEVVLVSAGCTLAIAMYGSFARPIWIDEFVHFALGSHRSTGEAWGTISRTAVTVNHGQTGVYMLLDFWLLRLFGASAVALRIPSLVSGMLLLVAATAVLRLRGYGLGWQLLLLVAFFGQANLMYFVGEARPYMPLAAASLGTLAYYLAREGPLVRPEMRALGAASILLGASMHPYFGVYWAALFLFAHWLALREKRITMGWRSLISHVDIYVSAVGVAVYFAIGRATWLRRGPEFTYDPYEWIRNDGLYRVFVDIAHMQFVALGATSVLVTVVAVPAILSLRRRWRPLARPLLPPIVLLFGALGLSLILWYLSYRRSYWVLPRQWVGSMALAPVAVVWWLAETVRLAWRTHRTIGAAVLTAGVMLLVGHAFHPALVRTPGRVSLRRAVAALRKPPAPLVKEISVPATDNDGWVALANRNIESGGKVWDVFRKYYWDVKCATCPYIGAR